MLIVVVEYKENGSCICEEKVVEDVIAFWKQCNDNEVKKLGKILRNQIMDLALNREAKVIFVDTADSVKREYLQESLKTLNIDLLVTYNLAGFENSTLTDGLAYNLVDCRQLHIIEKEGLPNEQFLSKEKSINMFFYKK